jgi:glycerate kinase
MVCELDQALGRYAAAIKRQFGIEVADMPGAGAAGGLGAAFAAFLGARLESGIDIVLDAVRFDEKLTGVDLVITGEGSIDRQTAYGKTVSGVLRRARRSGTPVAVIAGTIGEGADDLYDLGAAALFSIAPGPITLEESIVRSSELLSGAAMNVIRLFSAGALSSQGA